MCGRYVLNCTWREIVGLYRLTLPEEKPPQVRETFNAAPTQPLPIVRPIEGGDRELIIAGWGLIPHWLKNLDDKAVSTINARCETIREKPTFRQPFERRRCLVPASGWYEWTKAGTKKLPVYMTVEAKPFAFAGIWNLWTPPSGGPGFVSFAIVTTDASPMAAQYHNRMPVILEESQFDTWMLGTPDEAAALMKPYEGAMGAWAVSTRVNSAKFNDADLIRPIAAGAAR